jgi:hypothetical protein
MFWDVRVWTRRAGTWKAAAGANNEMRIEQRSGGSFWRNRRMPRSYHPHLGRRACSFGWWLMAGADLFWEKSIAGWLLMAGLFWEKSTVSRWLISQMNRCVGCVYVTNRAPVWKLPPHRRSGLEPCVEVSKPHWHFVFDPGCGGGGGALCVGTIENYGHVAWSVLWGCPWLINGFAVGEERFGKQRAAAGGLVKRGDRSNPHGPCESRGVNKWRPRWEQICFDDGISLFVF